MADNQVKIDNSSSQKGGAKNDPNQGQFKPAITATKPIVNNIQIEKNADLSTSLFWQFQKDFYLNSGPQAWIGQVPYYITSNSFIAKHYDELIQSALSDLTRQYILNKRKPIYIIELGGGTGKFAYQF